MKELKEVEFNLLKVGCTLDSSLLMKYVRMQ